MHSTSLKVQQLFKEHIHYVHQLSIMNTWLLYKLHLTLKFTYFYLFFYISIRLGWSVVQQGPELLHEPPAVSQRRHVLQHGRWLHVLLPHRLQWAQLRDSRRRQVQPEPLQEWRRLQGKIIKPASAKTSATPFCGLFSSPSPLFPWKLTNSSKFILS